MSKHLVKQLREMIAQHRADMRRLADEDELSEPLEQAYKDRIVKLEKAIANEKAS